MSSAPSSPPDSSVFIISPDLKAKYDKKFKMLCPNEDLLNGDKAKEIMVKSGLPTTVLAHIWSLADVDADGKMDINEFSIAFHLIALKLKGIELPRTLPTSLKVLVEPPPAFAAFGKENSEPAKPPPPQSTSNSISPSMSANKMGSLSNLSQGTAKLSKPSTPVISTEWAIPQPSKLKYTQLFNSHDRSRTGFLTGVQGRNILLESKLPQTVLAQIWNLSDIDSDGRLTCDEFVLAMHLVDKAKNDEPLPSKLPPDYIPPSFRRTSIGSFSHSSSVEDNSVEHDLNNSSKPSFEDKRRENFEKGQAELDRRRALLLDQQKREREERERKEREENARREKERLEAERKRQEEIERNREKLRQQELEKEEAKRRAMEVRELARKEMERQRQRELEQTRRTELLTQRARLLEEVQKLKSKRKAITIQHEQTDKQLVESKAIAAASREKVVKLKSEIDGMRIKRDETLEKQNLIKTQMKAFTEKQLLLEQEKVRVASQLKSFIANISNGTNADPQQFNSLGSILQSKQLVINQLRSQLERVENEYKTKKEDMVNSYKELENMKRKFETKRVEARGFGEKIEAKRIEAEKVRDGTNGTTDYVTTVTENNDQDVVWGQAVPTNFEWPSAKKSISNDNTQASTTTTQTKFKYRCLYAFQARNADEITIEPGDIIMVDTSACSEPDWLSGEINGQIGWFPKDYATLVEDDEPDVSFNSTEVNNNGVTTEASSIGTALPTHSNSSDKFVAKQAKAICDYSATETGHLSFFKDDLIRITDQHDSWYFGELCDKNTGNVTASGWLPDTYVQLISGDGTTVSNGITTNEVVSTTNDQDHQYYVSLYPFDSIEPGDLGFDSNELILVKKKDGDWWTGVIVDRATGREDPNRSGIFPSNFVGQATAADITQIKSNESEESKTSAVSTVATASANTSASPSSTISTNVKEKSQPTESKSPSHQLLDRKDSEACESPKPSKKSKSKKLEIVTAIAAYTATGAEQLSLEVGQLIQVRKKMATGWWEGELQAKGKKKQVGWFPASYVKPFGAGAGTAGGLGSMTGSAGSSARSTPDSAAKNAAEEPEIERVVALYSFHAERDDEISFEVNDLIRVLSKSDPTWWRGHNVRTGAIGLFPSNHVQVSGSAGATGAVTTEVSQNNDPYDQVCADEEEVYADDEVYAEDNVYPEEEVYVDDDVWLDDDEFDDDDSMLDYSVGSDNRSISTITGNDSNSLYSFNSEQTPQLVTARIKNLSNGDTADDHEKETRQEYRRNIIFEFISTEKCYVDDLNFIIQNFMNPLKQSSTLTSEDINLVFVNIEDIYREHLKFLNDFTERCKDINCLKICDCLLLHLTRILPFYKLFCLSQVSSISKVEHFIQNNEEFKQFLNGISVEKKIYISISAYLLKPMQRITKYPLLIEKILKYTPENHLDYNDCEKVLKLSKDFCKKINEACREMDNFNKLHWLQKNIVVECKNFSNKIDFNSETKFLGPRTLLKTGVLVKASSSKKLVAFLFNDFFMLTIPSKKNIKDLNESNFFSNEKALQSTYKLYREPLFFNQIELIDNKSFEYHIDPNTFSIFVRAKNYNISLRASSKNQCSSWLKEIDNAKINYLEIFNKNQKSIYQNISTSVTSSLIGLLYVTVCELVHLHTNSQSSLETFCKLAVGTDWSHLSSTFHTHTVKCAQPANAEFRKIKSPKLEVKKSKVINHLCKITWESTIKFNVSRLDQNLLIRCFNDNPFKPIECIGEASYAIEKLVEESRLVKGFCTKTFNLNLPNNAINETFLKNQHNQLLLKCHFVNINSI